MKTLILILCAAAITQPARAAAFQDGAKAFDKAKQLLASEYYNGTLADDDYYQAATRGLVEQLGDPWNKLYTPAEYAELKAELNGEVVGVGLQIKHDMDTGITDVTHVIAGSPAEKAGMKDGDQVLRINGKPYKGKELIEVVRVLRGKAGTKVGVTVLREGDARNFTLKREKLSWNSMEERMLPGKVGLVTIRFFQEKSGEQLAESLKRLSGARALVLDLRGNPGGKFESVTDCAGLLVPKGRTIVRVDRRGGKEETIVSKADPLMSVPLTVLINSATSSGGEILAAALRSGAGARLIGEKTFGKWNVQKLEELPNGYAFKFTVGVFHTAEGDSPNGKGIQPDLPVSQGKADIEELRRIQDPAERLHADQALQAAVSLFGKT